MALGASGYNSGYYSQKQNDAQYRYNTDKAQNAYGRFLSQQRGERTLGDLTQTYKRSLPNYRAGLAQRGLMGPDSSSGLANRAMGNYLTDYYRDYSRAQQDAQQEAQSYDLASAELDAYFNNSMAAIEQERQNEIANAALQIEALRPYLGGF